jgi:hypothetical protein
VSTTIHVSLSVRGALHWKDRELKNLLANQETGQMLTAAEAREALMDELAQGHEMIPFGEPCDGFSYKTGCPGHKIEETS